MEELQTQIEDVTSSLEETASGLSDTQDTVQTHDDTLNEHETRLSETEIKAGQLDFPLTQDSVDRIKEVYPTGTAVLAGGTVTVTDARMGPNTKLLYSRSVYGGTLGHLSYVMNTGSVVFNSNSVADTSTIIYLIL